MTALALGLHQRLEQERGPQFTGTDEYWKAIDTTMRKRFSDYFGEETTTETRAPRRAGSTNVVAPASRSTSPKKVVLTNSAVALAKKLGLTPEQYAKEVKALEKQGR
jgi:hypothetical protein